MLLRRISILSIVITLLLGLGLSTNIYAYGDSTTGLSSEFTKEQLKEIEQAKKETEYFIKEWNKRTDKKFYSDKTVTNDLTSAATAADFTTTSTYVGRPGVFYITLDGTSSSFTWAGGHAGIVYNTYYTVESFGNQKDASLNGVNYWPNNWNTRYNHFEARTTYDTTLEQDAQAAQKAATYIGRPYNYNFFYINQDDSFYCSQLVWYSFYTLFSIDLNDGGAVWPVDLIESSEAYLIYSQ